jgi:hypothetical protein
MLQSLVIRFWISRAQKKKRKINSRQLRLQSLVIRFRIDEIEKREHISKLRFNTTETRLFPRFCDHVMSSVRACSVLSQYIWIEGVSIPSKSKSLLIYINPLQSIWIENNWTSHSWFLSCSLRWTCELWWRVWQSWQGHVNMLHW